MKKAKTRCIKCGHTKFITNYHDEEIDGYECKFKYHDKMPKEHLHKRCKNCGYEWWIKPLDR